ncbi:hypothetical protein KVV02_006383 [Mortierella alpina]|uniref:Uncharacterized protein n=1 Tax=Mortierella alpina TaxID=64518 RepID=A0A9P8IF80_MORAP|nr:hypothetical protein KVV02_006383 [Mortierella alpina]
MTPSSPFSVNHALCALLLLYHNYPQSDSFSTSLLFCLVYCPFPLSSFAPNKLAMMGTRIVQDVRFFMGDTAHILSLFLSLSLSPPLLRSILVLHISSQHHTSPVRFIMRILSISLGLAAVAYVAAQAADPLAPVDAQSNFAMSAGGPDDLAFRAEEASMSISELSFRAEFLSMFDKQIDFNADTANCEGAKLIIKNAVKTVQGAVTFISNTVPIVAPIAVFLKNTLAQLNNVVDGALELSNGAAVIAITIAFKAAIAALTPFSLPVSPLAPIFSPLIETLKSIESTALDLIRCATGATKIEIQAAHCNSLADLYRLVVDDSTKTSGALGLSAEASEELKRLTAGSAAVLELMGKNSIAANNEALLSTRPIFAADVLDQYRIELLRATDAAENVKIYAETSLGVVVGISNALEACLRIAADPAGAIDDLNDELEAQARFDDMDDEDDEEVDEEDLDR